MSDSPAKEQSRRAFDRLAARYGTTILGRHSRHIGAAVLSHLSSPIRGRLLDVGCGPGLLLEILAKRCPDLALAGLDLSPEMIRVATQRLGAGIDLRVGDAELLPWEDRQFDYVLCVDAFHHFPNPQRALGEMHRVLKRGGRLVTADPTAPPVLRQLANVLNPLFRQGDVRMYGQREMTRMLDAQGFEEAEWSTSGFTGFVVTAEVRG